MRQLSFCPEELFISHPMHARSNIVYTATLERIWVFITIRVGTLGVLCRHFLFTYFDATCKTVQECRRGTKWNNQPKEKFCSNNLSKEDCWSASSFSFYNLSIFASENWMKHAWTIVLCFKSIWHRFLKWFYGSNCFFYSFSVFNTTIKRRHECNDQFNSIIK